MIKFNIKLQRLLHNEMTQKELIDLSGIRPQTVSDYENNKAVTIRVEHLNKLCEIFDCQPADLITYAPDNAPNEKGE